MNRLIDTKVDPYDTKITTVKIDRDMCLIIRGDKVHLSTALPTDLARASYLVETYAMAIAQHTDFDPTL